MSIFPSVFRFCTIYLLSRRGDKRKKPTPDGRNGVCVSAYKSQVCSWLTCACFLIYKMNILIYIFQRSSVRLNKEPCASHHPSTWQLVRRAWSSCPLCPKNLNCSKAEEEESLIVTAPSCLWVAAERSLSRDDGAASPMGFLGPQHCLKREREQSGPSSALHNDAMCHLYFVWDSCVDDDRVRIYMVLSPRIDVLFVGSVCVSDTTSRRQGRTGVLRALGTCKGLRFAGLEPRWSFFFCHSHQALC